MALLTVLTLIFGGLGVVYGVLKLVHDIKNGKLPFSELRIITGGALLAASTFIASGFATRVAEVEGVAAAVAAVPQFAADPNLVGWWLVAIPAWAVSLILLPSPKQMAEEYALENHGLAGLLMTRGPGMR